MCQVYMVEKNMGQTLCLMKRSLEPCCMDETAEQELLELLSCHRSDAWFLECGAVKSQIIAPFIVPNKN